MGNLHSKSQPKVMLLGNSAADRTSLLDDLESSGAANIKWERDGTCHVKYDGLKLRFQNAQRTGELTPAELKSMVLVADAVLHVVRASDARLYSSLWELYLVIRLVPPHVPVVVVVLNDDEESLAAACALAQRSELPPRNNLAWATERGRREAVERDWSIVEGNGATNVHGFPVMTGSSTPRGEYPVLSLLHHGSYIVLPVAVPPSGADAAVLNSSEAAGSRAAREAAGDARKPMRLLKEALTRPAEGVYDVVVKRER